MFSSNVIEEENTHNFFRYKAANLNSIAARLNYGSWENIRVTDLKKIIPPFFKFLRIVEDSSLLHCSETSMCKAMLSAVYAVLPSLCLDLMEIN